MNSRLSTSCGMNNLLRVSKILLFLTLFITSKSLFAQNEDDMGKQPKKITGSVNGSDKTPLVGATVKVKGRSVGTKADEHGNLGPVYGYQWRSWPTPDGKHIDQLTEVIETIKKKDRKSTRLNSSH